MHFEYTLNIQKGVVQEILVVLHSDVARILGRKHCQLPGSSPHPPSQSVLEQRRLLIISPEILVSSFKAW